MTFQFAVALVLAIAAFASSMFNLYSMSLLLTHVRNMQAFVTEQAERIEHLQQELVQTRVETHLVAAHPRHTRAVEGCPLCPVLLDEEGAPL